MGRKKGRLRLGGVGPAANRQVLLRGRGLPSHGLPPPPFRPPFPQRGEMGWEGEGANIFKEKCIFMPNARGSLLLLMNVPLPGVAGWMLFIPGSSNFQ